MFGRRPANPGREPDKSARHHSARHGRSRMNIELRAKERSQNTRLDIVDCDFHPKLTLDQLKPFLSNQWWSYLQTYGNRSRHGYSRATPIRR